MRTRLLGIGVSAALSVASLFLLVNPGLNYGVDFTGGSMIEASAPSAMNIADVRAGLQRANLGEVSLQQIKDASTILVRVQQRPADELAPAVIAERAKAAILEVAPDASFSRVDIIGPKVNETLARSVFTSLTALLALLPMAIWGGAAVSSFAIPMVFGIAVAASSSVFVAAPLLLFLGRQRIIGAASMDQDTLRALERSP